MKKRLSIVLFGIVAFGLTGCYTQLVVEEDDDYYVYSEPLPVIIYYPVPVPVFDPVPDPPNEPEQPVYKTRKPVPPQNNYRKRDDIRNSGGRNEGENRSRR
jgi:hypothetical protein